MAETPGANAPIQYAATAFDPRQRDLFNTGSKDNPKDWQAYTGTRGGRGWINTIDGEVRYQEHKPGTAEAKAEESPKKEPAAPPEPKSPGNDLPIMGQDVQPGQPKEDLPELPDELFDDLYQRMEIEEYEVGGHTLWRSANPKPIAMKSAAGRAVNSLEASIHPRDYPKPDHDRQRLIVACGMGVDSYAMLIHLKNEGIRPDVIHWADTGSERHHTYKAFDSLQAWCKKVGFPPIVIVRRRVTRAEQSETNPDKINHRSLFEQGWNTGQVPSAAFYQNHSCSISWKLDPQRRFDEGLPWLWDYDNPNTAIGFDADEVEGGKRRGLKGNDSMAIEAVGFDAEELGDRRSGGKKEKKKAVTNGSYSTKSRDKDENAKYETWFPLAEAGLDRDDCIRLIREEGLPLPGKSACFMCPYAQDCELQAMKESGEMDAALALEQRFHDEQKKRVAAGKVLDKKKNVITDIDKVPTQGLGGKDRWADKIDNLDTSNTKAGLYPDPQPAPRFKNR